MSQYTIECLSKYVEIVCELDNHLIRNGADLNEQLLYRGQSNKKYELLPSIGRNRSYSSQISIFNEERNLIDMAKFKLPDIFSDAMQPIELLALLQHHGIPTRLLDITENALVGLFFACSGKQDTDGEVIVFKNNENYVTNYPVVNAIAESYKFTLGSETALSTFYGDVVEQEYFIEQRRMLKSIHNDTIEGGRWIERLCSNPIFVYAPIRGIRQRIQKGRYILFPNDIEPYYLDKTEDAFIWKISSIPKTHECIVGTITIPGNRKKSILKQLDLCGISEDVLFEDNTDIVCKGIRETFERKIKGDFSFERDIFAK